ncbi:MAG TPA: 3'-5' exonuclease [Anaeromyxobacter sp.]|nr:3'-5' exonuclease [Anaeromyxobacter sp.]
MEQAYVVVALFVLALAWLIWRAARQPSAPPPPFSKVRPPAPVKPEGLDDSAELDATPPTYPRQSQEQARGPLDTAGSLPELVGVDVETTGFDPAHARIVQIAAIRLKVTANQGAKATFCECGRLVTYVNPERKRIGATQIHHITLHDVENAPTFDALTAQLGELLQGAVVVGHNVDFDLRFFRASFARAGVEFPQIAGTYCTLHNARAKLSLPDYKLATCCQALDIPYKPHEAESDAEAALFLCGKLSSTRRS